MPLGFRHLSYTMPQISAVKAETELVESFQPEAAPALVLVGLVELSPGELDDGVAEGLRGEGEGLALHVLGFRGLGALAVEEVQGGLRAEPGGRDTQARVADRVGRSPVVRRAEEGGEAGAGVDRAAPAVGEPDALELREVREEVLGEHREALVEIVVLRLDGAIEAIDRVVAAEEDPVVGGQAV